MIDSKREQTKGTWHSNSSIISYHIMEYNKDQQQETGQHDNKNAHSMHSHNSPSLSISLPLSLSIPQFFTHPCLSSANVTLTVFGPVVTRSAGTRTVYFATSRLSPGGKISELISSYVTVSTKSADFPSKVILSGLRGRSSPLIYILADLPAREE